MSANDARDDLYMEALGHFGAKRFDEAIASHEKALELDPAFIDIYLGLSMAWSKKGDQDKAIEIAKKGAEVDPDEPLVHTNLSMFYMRKGMIEEAEKESALVNELNAKAGKSAL